MIFCRVGRQAPRPFHVCHTLPMCVLRIEHRIADLDTWLQDFASRAPAREQAGVTAVQVFQSEDDPHYIVENLFFDTDDAANNFRTFLREQVWPSASWLASNPSAEIFHELKTLRLPPLRCRGRRPPKSDPLVRVSSGRRGASNTDPDPHTNYGMTAPPQSSMWG